MKTGIYALGLDDGPFTFGDEEVDVIGVIMNPDMHIKGVMHFTVEVDGDNATEKTLDAIKNSRYFEDIKVIFTDGIAFGGFNLLDIHRIGEVTGKGVIAVVRHRPDVEEMISLAQRKFPQREWYIPYLQSLQPIGVEVEIHGTRHRVYANFSGLSPEDGAILMRKFMHNNLLPEPVRVAHLIATAIKTGESRGRA